MRPTLLEPTHPLGRLGPRDMGVLYRTDIYGVVTVVGSEQGPDGARAAMHRDALGLLR